MDPCVPFASTHYPKRSLERVPGALWRVRTTHPTRPGFGHTCTLLTTWTELSDAVRIGWLPPRTLAPAHVAKDQGPSKWMYAVLGRRGGADAPPYPTTLDAVLRALRATFLRDRAAIYVCLRNNALVMFVPFANETFASRRRVRLLDPAGGADLEDDAGSYADHKARATGVDERRSMIRDTSRWWWNGHVACNVAPAGVWGDAHVAALHHMIFEACATGVVPDADFVINKRDAPLGLLPIPTFNLYGDVARHALLPTPEDWLLGGFGPYPARGTDASADLSLVTIPEVHRERWAAKQARAVFRGSSTGAGVDIDTNVRIKIADIARRNPDLIDGGITSWNARDRIVRDGDDECVVTCPNTKALRERFGTVETIPLPEQAARFRFAIYAQGHQAASRLTALFHCGFTVIYVRPTAPGPDTWISGALRFVRWAPGETGVSSKRAHQCHAIEVEPDASNLTNAVRWLVANPECAFSLARVGQRFVRESVLTRERMARYVRAAINSFSHDGDDDATNEDAWFGLAHNDKA